MDGQRFISLWERCVGTGGEATFERVDARYREPHRHYHGPQHIEHCLRQLDRAGDEVINRDAVELALWFHDVVFDVPRAPAEYNESRSAEFFLDCLEGRGVAELRADVSRLIRVTSSSASPKAPDEHFMVDIDLSGFGQPWPEFLRDSRAVRAEQPRIPDDEFSQALHKLMQSLLARPNFYFTEFFRSHYEQTARDNINRYLAEVPGCGSIGSRPRA